MKIYNFNYPFYKTHSPYIKQYREYIQSFWHQIQSLYDYIINFNPPYEIINGTDNVNHINNILTDDIVNGWYGRTTPTEVYYADRLNFRQGFINTGQDAKLRWAPQSSNYLDFLSGYVCIANTNKVANTRYTTDYLILPASVPSLYWYSYNVTNFIARYYDNKVGNRVDAIVFTLPSQPCRFNYIQRAWGEIESGISINSNNLKTTEGIIWTGDTIQIHHYYSPSWETTPEEIFIDGTYDIHTIHSLVNDIKTLQQEVSIDKTNPMSSALITTYII